MQNLPDWTTWATSFLFSVVPEKNMAMLYVASSFVVTEEHDLQEHLSPRWQAPDHSTLMLRIIALSCSGSQHSHAPEGLQISRKACRMHLLWRQWNFCEVLQTLLEEPAAWNTTGALNLCLDIEKINNFILNRSNWNPAWSTLVLGSGSQFAALQPLMIPDTFSFNL